MGPFDIGRYGFGRSLDNIMGGAFGRELGMLGPAFYAESMVMDDIRRGYDYTRRDPYGFRDYGDMAYGDFFSHLDGMGGSRRFEGRDFFFGSGRSRFEPFFL